MSQKSLSAAEALEKLKEGNKRYLSARVILDLSI